MLKKRYPRIALLPALLTALAACDASLPAASDTSANGVIPASTGGGNNN